MKTLGVDLASRPEATGACLVEWGRTGAVARIAPAPLDDAALTRLATDADVVAIDAPLGWPDGFVAAVAAHHRGERWPSIELSPLRYRVTDLAVARQTRVLPLSVSTDLIAVCAFRAARLQRLLADRPARDGSGRLVEVYPAGALRVWGITAVGYKRGSGAAVRARIVDEVVRRSPWLTVDAAALRRRDHDLDALLCALVARAAATGRSAGPPPEHAAAARREGWIHLPTCQIEALVNGWP